MAVLNWLKHDLSERKQHIAEVSEKKGGRVKNQLAGNFRLFAHWLKPYWWIRIHTIFTVGVCVCKLNKLMKINVFAADEPCTFAVGE